MTKIIIIGSILVILAVIVLVVIPHRHNEDCKWVAPLKTDYVLCNDNKVREK